MIYCPICNTETFLLTQKKDRFNQEYIYQRCKGCRFLFEKDLVENKEQLAKKVSGIYTKDYFSVVDGGWKVRGDGFLKIIKKVIAIHKILHYRKKVTVLDYGGGNGYITSQLKKNAMVFYYDKYDKPTIAGAYTVLEKPKKTDIIYAVELVEHLTDINEWDFLKELSPGVFVFTTCLLDNIPDENLLQWEYLNPDAGHTALYSSKSLYLLGKKYGFVYFFFPNISTHIFLKNTLLSKIPFVYLEYGIYSFFRKMKHLFS